jgi:hypothetical protein
MAKKVEDISKEWYSNEENKERLPQLVGKKVVEVQHYSDYYKGGAFTEGWLIIFSDGSVLTARDGEYGDDSFQFVRAEEQEELLNPKKRT